MADVRVLFSTTAGAGHFGPMIPVARACQAAGHDVAVAAPASFAASVADAGLAHLPFPDVPADQIGAVYGQLPSLPRREANRIAISEIFGRLDAQAALPTLLTLLHEWQPAIVVREPAEFGALVAAEALRVPQVQVAIDMGGFIAAAADWLDQPLRELEQLAGIRELHGSQRALRTSTFTSVPAALDDPSAKGAGRVWRYRTDTAAVAPSLPAAWGDPTAPLVYVSFGSVAGSVGRFAALYPAVVEVLAELPVRVLITTGTAFDPTRLHPLPANVWATQWWPQAAVMPEAALVVGHGGFGTTMTALAAGVPQLVMPLFSSDQFLNAERVDSVGVGVRLLGGLDALSEVPRVVTELLEDPRYAEAARRIAGEMEALPDVTTTVALVEELAS